MDESELQQLIEKYLFGRCNNEKKALLEIWYLDHKEHLSRQLSESDIQPATDLIWTKLDQGSAVKSNGTWKHYGSAAAAVLILSVYGIFYFARRHTHQQIAVNQSHDLKPAINHAILKTAAG